MTPRRVEGGDDDADRIPVIRLDRLRVGLGRAVEHGLATVVLEEDGVSGDRTFRWLPLERHLGTPDLDRSPCGRREADEERGEYAARECESKRHEHLQLDAVSSRVPATRPAVPPDSPPDRAARLPVLVLPCKSQKVN